MLSLRHVLRTTLTVARLQLPQPMQSTQSCLGPFQTQAGTGMMVRGLAGTHEAGAGEGAQPAVAEYEEVLSASRAGGDADADSARLLVDVREPPELAKLGHIPTALNIPLGSVRAALGEMSAEEFERTYGRRKPTPRTDIIFYCQVGQRSHLAQQQALQLGSKNYLGSYNEWSSKQKS